MNLHTLELTVNGRERRCEIESTELLVDVLRNRFGLTGTHIGCDTAQCGACTVVINGAAIKSCNTLALQQQQTRCLTIEVALTAQAEIEVLQKSFSRHHALQCGFCTPGMIMRALAMVDEPISLTKASVADALEGNLCRCTGYTSIVNAVIEAVTEIRGQRKQTP